MELFFLLLLIILMAVALGSGYPVAFALPGSSILTILLAGAAGYLFEGQTDAYFAQGGPAQWLNAGVTNLRGVYWEPERDTLIAIPLFIFMGIMLQRSKIAEDLLVTMARLFGPLPGGLGISVVFVGALLAATTGIVGATVVAMGLISLPAMMRNNYSQPLATGTIVASGTLGQIIPPSIVLIILADQLSSAADQAGTLRKALYRETTGELSMPSAFDVVSTSAGEMFLGAFGPGIVLVLLYMVFIFGFSLWKPEQAPPLAPDDHQRGNVVLQAFGTLIPPLLLIFLVLGSIIAGVATVNQAGAIGAAGALVMAGYRLRESERGAYRPAILCLVSLLAVALVVSQYDTNIRSIGESSDRLGIVLAALASIGLISGLVWSGWRVYRADGALEQVMLETAKATSLVFIILLGAAILTAAFRAFGGEELVRHFLEGLPGGFWFKFAVVMAVIFVLGFFLDYIEIAVVVVPIVAPILLADPDANISAVWLGVMIGLNIQTSFLTPPFGFALFYLRGIAPKAIKTINIYKGVVPFILLQLVALGIVAKAPQLVNYLPNRISLLSENAPPPRNPRLSYCVDSLQDDYIANNGSEILAGAREVSARSWTYAPQPVSEMLGTSLARAEIALARHSEAVEASTILRTAEGTYRPVHVHLRALERDIRRLESAYSTSRDDNEAVAVSNFDERINQLRARIPSDWASTREGYRSLRDDAQTTRRSFQSAASEAYLPVRELIDVLESPDRLKELLIEVEALRRDVARQEAEALLDPLRSISRRVGEVPGTDEIRNLISDARSALRGREPNRELAMSLMYEAVQAGDAEIDWRSSLAPQLLPSLLRLEEVMRPGFGLREQRNFERDQALFVASCLSVPRSLATNF